MIIPMHVMDKKVYRANFFIMKSPFNVQRCNRYNIKSIIQSHFTGQFHRLLQFCNNR